MDLTNVIDQGLGVVATGSVSALVAMGLALSFRLMGVINLAHGDFMMVGAYAAYVGLQMGAPFVLAVVLAAALGTLLGGVTEIALIRRFYARPELAILGTFALGIVLRQLVEIAFGKDYKPFPNPLPGSVTILGDDFPLYRLALAAAAGVILLAIALVLALSPLGVRVRAVAQDSGLTETLGVRSTALKLGVFAFSGTMAGVAGALVAPTVNVDPSMGINLLFTAFVIVIIAGSRLPMVILAALVAALVQNMTTLAANALAAKLAVLLLALVVLVLSQRQTKGVTV